MASAPPPPPPPNTSSANSKPSTSHRSTSTSGISKQRICSSTSINKIVFPGVLDCTFVSKLGEGAYGKVYLVSERATDTLKACKVYDLRKIKSDYLNKFAPREMDILLKVSHPHIIGTHRMCKAGFCVYMMMDYAEQRDMEHYISKVCSGNINEARARVWTRQIANALEYLHEVGIGHRDIKCDNILITKYLNAKLADFGFSRIFKSSRDVSSTFCGTTSYAAPEIIKNVAYNPRSADIWSLGVVLYRVLNKRFPFGDPGTKIRVILKRQESMEYTFSASYEISIEAKKLIKRMLQSKPRLRPTAKDVQCDAWFLKEPMKLAMAAEEKEAMERGKAKAKEFQQRYAVVKALCNPNNLEVITENSEKTYPDAGVNVSEQSILTIICNPKYQKK